MKKVLKIFLAVLIILMLTFYFYFVYPAWGFPFYDGDSGTIPLTPAWALECWLWEDDVNTEEYVDELLEGYKEYDIPIRTILIDSPWSLRYNDFEIDTLRYPNPESWFRKLENEGYRTVLWMTPMINSYSNDTHIKDSKNWYEEIKSKGFLIDREKQNSWWKGKGGFIDYTNEDAVKWWQNLQKNILDFGIDGWKLDGAATLLWSDLFGLPFFYSPSSKGTITTREYMNLYYREEFRYGLSRNPEFVTLSRAIDGFYTHPEGFSPLDASPVNWVGDQKHTWKSNSSDDNEDHRDLMMDGVDGIETAIQYVLRSAELGYNIVGSDIGGFSGRVIPPNLYIRWTQFSTFCGLFLNGGHGERRLWKRSDEELEIMRKFSWLHTELIPYMYHYVVSANRGERTLQKPINLGKYQYMFGDYLMVVPIYEDRQDRSITMPEGKWHYFFNDNQILFGQNKYDLDFPMNEYPVFIREGAIIPMNIKRDYTNIGVSNSEGFLTVLIYPANSNTFTYYNPQNYKDSTQFIYNKSGDDLILEIKGKALPHILQIFSKRKPISILLDDNLLSENRNWYFNLDKNKIYIRTSTYSIGKYVLKF